MLTEASIAPVLKAIAWPVVALVLGLLFRSEIKDVFRRLRAARLPGGAEASFDYGTATVDKKPGVTGGPPTIPRQHTGRIEGIRLSNSGNLFWLGHDLMWTADVVLRGAPLHVVLHGLNQALRHAHALGFSVSAVVSRLEKLRDEVDASTSGEWTSERRNQVANDINRIVAAAGDVAVAGQVDFREVTR